MKTMYCVIPLVLLSLTTPVVAGTLVDRDSALERLPLGFEMCDGPAWDGAGSLYVPDVKAGKLYRYQPRGQRRVVVLPEAGRISAVYFNHGRLYLADNGDSRISLLVDGGKQPLPGHDPEAKPPLRPNDLVVDNQGGIYYTLTAVGQVMYLPPGGEPQVAAREVDSANGIMLSPDEQTLYVSSAAPKQIWAFDLATPGQPTNRRLFATMDDGPARGADGMAIDRAGNVYCAGASDIWIWSPAGELREKITTPTRPINCAFGDADLRSLYITCQDGLYRQRMLISGRPPQPPLSADEQPTASADRVSTALPPNVTPYLDVPYAAYGSRRLLADIFVPNDVAGPRPTLVIVHGGGWTGGDKTKFRHLALELARRGYVTAAIEYRLAYDTKFPAAIHDCNAAVRYLRAEADRYQIDPNRIGAIGGSAGAHIVGLMAAAPSVKDFQGDGGQGEQSSRLQAAVMMAGPMQLDVGPVAERSRQRLLDSNSNAWFGKTVDEAPELYRQASPYNHFAADTPPMLFLTGSLDRPERDEPSVARLKELGVWTEQKVYADGQHGCWMRQPWFGQMTDDMDAFFKQHLR